MAATTAVVLLLCFSSLCMATPLKTHGVNENLGNPWLQQQQVTSGPPSSNIIPPSHECMQEFNKLHKEWWKGIHDSSMHDFMTSRQGRMADATGRPPANVLSGNLQWLGSRDECLGVPGAQYCVMPMHVENVVTEGKFGVCFPKGCSKLDAVGFSQSTMYLYLKTAYYLAGFFFPGDHVTFDETAKGVVC